MQRQVHCHILALHNIYVCLRLIKKQTDRLFLIHGVVLVRYSCINIIKYIKTVRCRMPRLIYKCNFDESLGPKNVTIVLCKESFYKTIHIY